RPDEADALAFGHAEADAVERDEPAEALAEIGDLEEGGAHEPPALTRRRPTKPTSRPFQYFCTRPRMPLGAMMTKPVSRRPTINRLTADEMVTVASCCSVPSSTAPISGMAMEFTAYSSPKADDGCR